MYTWAELHALYRLTLDAPPSNLEPRYNIAPTTMVDIVAPTEGGGHELRRARWGLVPGWWKKTLKEVPSTFNARDDKIRENGPMVRDAFRRSRVLVPASGFYEWRKEGKERFPEYITRADGKLLTFAGLASRWKDPESGEDLLTTTIITTEPNAFMARLHDRMPVVLEEQGFDAWLSEPRADLLKPAAEGVLRSWPVSQNVNKVAYREPDCIAPLAA